MASALMAADQPESTELLRDMFSAALRSVSADVCLPPYLPTRIAGRTLVVAVGKAAAAMAQVALEHLDGDVGAIVLTPHGHGLPALANRANVQLFEAGHPLPDENGANAALTISAEVKRLGAGDRLLALISGGGSALLAMPADGVTIDDKKALTRELLLCGASIKEINCVRAHLSQIKGGRLALAAAPAEVVTLAVSDIPGDDPALIASGPTVFDRTTLADARKILDNYGIPPSAAVAAALADPANETPSSNVHANHNVQVVARSRDAMRAAGQIAHAAGYTPVYLGSDIEGEATEIGVIHAALALHYAGKGGRWALLSGGETTVTVSNREGRGGRNTQYLLSLALALNGAPDIAAIACDTDGIDGSEDNAGATIDPGTMTRAARLDIEGPDLLRRNLAYDFFERLDDLVITGPTRTNVNDFRAILIDR